MKEQQPVSQDDIKKVMSFVGRKGGQSRSEKKIVAATENIRKAHAAGKKGGRPKGSGKKGE